MKLDTLTTAKYLMLFNETQYILRWSTIEGTQQLGRETYRSKTKAENRKKELESDGFVVDLEEHTI